MLSIQPQTLQLVIIVVLVLVCFCVCCSAYTHIRVIVKRFHTFHPRFTEMVAYWLPCPCLLMTHHIVKIFCYQCLKCFFIFTKLTRHNLIFFFTQSHGELFGVFQCFPIINNDMINNKNNMFVISCMWKCFCRENSRM